MNGHRNLAAGFRPRPPTTGRRGTGAGYSPPAGCGTAGPPSAPASLQWAWPRSLEPSTFPLKCLSEVLFFQTPTASREPRGPASRSWPAVPRPSPCAPLHDPTHFVWSADIERPAALERLQEPCRDDVICCVAVANRPVCGRPHSRWRQPTVSGQVGPRQRPGMAIAGLPAGKFKRSRWGTGARSWGRLADLR